MPTWAAILVATFAPTSAVIVAFLALLNSQRKIHVLVNNRLTEALNEIRRLGGESEEF